MIARLLVCVAVASATGCAVVYTSPDVAGIAPGSEAAQEKGFAVTVIDLTPQTVLEANIAAPAAAMLPTVFDLRAVDSGYRSGAGALAAGATSAAPVPAPARASGRAAAPTRLPPAGAPEPYRLGVGDVVSITRPDPTGRSETLNVTVQDSGAVVAPGVGAVSLVDLTADQARERLLRAFVDTGLDPSFTFDVVGFNSRDVQVGGAVAAPARVPLTFTPLLLPAAILTAGGVAFEDVETATVQINRGGETYTVPVRDVFGSGPASEVALVDGDIVFVDVGSPEEQRRRAFDEQVDLRQLEVETARIRSETARTAADNARFQSERFDAVQNTFLRRVELGAEPRGYAYLTGEVSNPLRFPLPFESSASLADVLHENRGVPMITGDMGEIYVLRAASTDLTTINAYHLNAENMASMVLATRFQIHPNDVVFVAEQPITTWNRVLSQIFPNSTVGLANSFNNAIN